MTNNLYHTEKWWRSKYIQLVNWAQRNKLNTTLTGVDKEGNTYLKKSEEAGIREIKSQWMVEHNKGTKDIYAAIKYSWQYEAPYKTALAFHQSIKKHADEDNLKVPTLKELKKLTTSELYDQYGDYIVKDYNEKLEEAAIKKYLKQNNIEASPEEVKTLTPDDFYQLYGFRPDLTSNEFKKILNSADVQNEAQEFIDENWWGS